MLAVQQVLARGELKHVFRPSPVGMVFDRPDPGVGRQHSICVRWQDDRDDDNNGRQRDVQTTLDTNHGVGHVGVWGSEL
jgi:hypothetical protein